MLAMLGWNDGTDQEIFTLDELIQKFSMERVHKGGAKFDFDKAKWFNHEWIKRSDVGRLKPEVSNILSQKNISVEDDNKLVKVIELVKDRCTLLTDFYEQAHFLFATPQQWDLGAIKPKWNEAKQLFFLEAIRQFQLQTDWDATTLEHGFKELAAASQIKPGEVLMPLRVMLVGGKYGPGVFDIATTIGKEETIHRIESVLKQLQP
jgi:glutamyl-tRNA synthetase